MSIDGLMTFLGRTRIGEWPTMRAARLAADLLEELRAADGAARAASDTEAK